MTDKDKKQNEPCDSRNFEEREGKILELTQNAVGMIYPIY